MESSITYIVPAVEEVLPQETYNEQFSVLVSQQEVLISQQSEIAADVANMDNISQYSFVILLIAIVCVVISKTFFHGGY